MTDSQAPERDVSRAIQSWLHEDRHEDASRVAGAVLDQVEATPQRRATWWRAWRMPFMSKFVSLGLGAAAVVVALVIGSQLLGFPDSGGVGGAPSAEPAASPVGGTVEYRMDGLATTTDVDAVADGATVSGTAVTTSDRGTHTVQVECAAQDGDTWAFGGTTEETTLPGERAGDWSAVIVRDGSPQRIGIWLSDAKSEGMDCDGWLGAMDMSTIDASNFQPVESGGLVPPPDLAP